MALMPSANSIFSSSRNSNSAAGLTYALFALATVTVGTWISDGDFSAILTASVSLQCLGILQLAVQVWYKSSVQGISRKSLVLFAAMLAIRLSVTTTKHGYLPVDSTGDFLYQLADVLSLVLALQIIFAATCVHERTYMCDFDSMDTKWVLPVSLVLGVCVHANLNHSFFWDSVWFVSLYAETFALLPQLWMMTKIGGEVEGMTSHFVACMTASKVLAWIVWFHGYPELAPGYVECPHTKEILDHGNSNWAGYAIMLAYTTQVAVCADFLYHYAAAIVSNRRMMLPLSA